jgi:hypothetical protein
LDPSHCPEPVHRRIQQGAEDARPRDCELAPEFNLDTALCLDDGR